MKNEKACQIIQRISNFGIIILVVSLILEGVSEIFKWSSLVSCIGIYICILIKEQHKNKKISIQSGILCMGAIIWLIVRTFYPNDYVNIGGQCIVYGFLINTGRVMTGKVNKTLLVTMSLSVLVNALHLVTEIHWLFLGMAILQIIVFLQFLDPILEKIALEHREKRSMTKSDLNEHV